MNINQLVEKDKQKQVNPFAYTRFQSKLSEMNKPNNYRLVHGLQIICLVLAFVFSMNLFSQISSTKDVTSQERSFEQFAEENCFDILVNYYPSILFE